MAAMFLPQAQAQITDAFLGEIRTFAGDVAPQGWAFCNGQLLPIENNQGIFSVIGTNFGGDGARTFALPDMRGRAVAGAGNPSQNSYYQGIKVGDRDGSTPQQVYVEKGNTKVPTTLQPFVAVRYIICLNGLFPKPQD